MGLGSQIYAFNDNSPLTHQGVDDRMGFNAFLREAKLAKENEARQEEAKLLQAQNNAEPRRASFKSFIQPLKVTSLLLLEGLILLSVFLLITVTSPMTKIFALNSLALSSLIMSARSKLGQYGRWHEVWAVIALASCFGAIYLLGTDFAVTGLSLSGSLAWVMMAAIALVVSALIQSRTALILSLMITSIWGYGLFTSSISLSPIILAFPVLAAMQFIAAEDSRDKVVRLSYQLMLSAWTIGAIYLANMSGITTPQMLITAVMLISALLYAASTHPFKIWKSDPLKGTALLGWTGVMLAVLMTAWFWISPERFGLLSGASILPSPLANFIWQIGLIGAIGLLFIISALRHSRASYSLSRRLLGAFVMALLPLSLFFQQELHLFFNRYGLELIPLYFALACFGSVAILTLRKFISAIRFEHFGWMLVCTLLAIGTSISLSAIPEWTTDLILVTIIAALGTSCALMWTQKKYAAPNTVYKPYKHKPPSKRHYSDAAAANLKPHEEAQS